MKVYAVIPAYNENPRIRGTVRGVSPFVDSIIVVDDGSTDGTWDAICGRSLPRAMPRGSELATSHAERVCCLRHAVNRGQGAALRTGTDAALRLGADVIVHMDADGQHDPSLIPLLVRTIKEGGADVVFGSRFLGLTSSDMPFSRSLLLKAAKAFNSLVMGIPRSVTDPQSGMRAMTREAALTVDFRQDRMAHCSEILRLVTHSRLRWLEIPIRVHYSQETLAKGQKSMDALKIAWHLLLGAFTR